LLNFHSASTQTGQSADRRVAPLGHIILIQSQPVFARFRFLTLRENEEATNTNSINPIRCPTNDLPHRGERVDHDTTDAV